MTQREVWPVARGGAAGAECEVRVWDSLFRAWDQDALGNLVSQGE